jgi:hypothetical protein
MWFQGTPDHSALRFSRPGSSCRGHPGPRPVRRYFFRYAKKNNFSQAQKQPPKQKADTPPPARATGDFKEKFDWIGTWKTRDGNETPLVIQRGY